MFINLLTPRQFHVLLFISADSDDNEYVNIIIGVAISTVTVAVTLVIMAVTVILCLAKKKGKLVKEIRALETQQSQALLR